MKQSFLKYSLLLLLPASMMVGCKKQLEEQFRNPEVYSQTQNLFGGIFRSMLTEHKIFVQDYGEFYWQLNSGCEVPGYVQLAQRLITDRYAWFSGFGDLTGVSGFGAVANSPLWTQRLNDFYTRARFWAVLNDELNKVSGDALINNKIYYTLATVMKDYVALINVDFYNSIPYSEAFQGSQGVFYPKFDDPKEIYVSVMNELKQIYQELPQIYNAMTDLGKNLFGTYDVALNGDINKWLEFINSLRLKYAVRISGVDETLARAELTDVLAKPLPTQDLLQPIFADVAPESNGFWMRGLGENSFSSFIPNIMMRRMNRDLESYQPVIDDPRLPVIAMPTKFFEGAPQPNGARKYIGVSYDADAQKADYVAGHRYATTPNSFIESLRQNAKSQYNYTTYTHNAKFPAYMMSVAEIDLLLAEVALKNLGNTGKTAGEHIKNAIIHSTDFWYARNAESQMSVSFRTKALQNSYFVGPLTFSTNRFGEDSALWFHPAKPAAGIVSQYADSIVTRFNTRPTSDDKMEILMQQKYIHLNLVAPYELWTEIRRTRHPYLEPMTFVGVVMKPFPERLRYPLSASQTNPDKYLAVQPQDNFTSHIFWVPADKRGVLPYWPNYNYQ
jgi:hypothetical protein